MSESEVKPSNFIRQIIDNDLASGKHQQVVTRFPPEPNGFLHVGHAKSICLNFGIAKDYQGFCNLRYDDTNPEKESIEYANSIAEAIEWLGFHWHGEKRYASDYFEQLYLYAEELIQKGLAYVDDSTPEQMRAMRGNLTEPGQHSPFRDRGVEENLDLFRRMRAGEFPDGSRVLRAKIDMASPNINLRDPVIYRIRRAHHWRTGDAWCIYPMYDYTHCISDALEGITHSICTLEFEDHRPLYDWVLDNISVPCHPQQIEFARLQLEGMLTSKRKLNDLVQSGVVSGWDDPRMPTLMGLRRRGVTPNSLRVFCERVGVTKQDSVLELQQLETCVREDLDQNAARAMAVLNPLKIVLNNWPAERIDELSAPAHPQKPELGNRKLFMTREIYIDQNDFREVGDKDFKRLVTGGEVRLRNSYVIRCDEVIKNEAGDIVELRGSVDMDTLGKNPEGRKVKGVVHWVSASHSKPATVRLYDSLFTESRPWELDDYKSALNPDSLVVIEHARVEPSLAEAKPEDRFQFEREGYFVADRFEHSGEKLVFNRTIGLKDSFAKLDKR
ncbi:glutamine--tRNA ligase/YqeY domain fusion protein [Permianibacter aggregans]|uniref:Glutamine--tRNA ligase n=1 Tax=Permianibacter aggregans TaxID=1510150 RepID=A0A4R6UR80_9GAMM|nr:glutamine--tRNA ligase/YqeY domain fusion protein [Permianibacter aggregans]QGX41183.1 glutamine--tRNA ligase/YqeY domain fusion protein [Permianibacter aggregans]TDQ45784.1 glutaminyl-tRNA synthetase [Permianibacter aggregans]